MQEYQEDNLGVDSDEKHETSLSKGHKFAVAGLAFFSIFIIFMWSVQFKNSINPSFNSTGNSAENNNNTATCSGPDCGNDSDLKIKDTDGDGITDYDELYIYNTSPYLEDSDSDGFSDFAEIESENDPNCPTGRDCYGSELPDSTNTSIDIKNSDNLDSLDVNNNDELSNVLSGQSDASTIRAMLLQAGMDKNILDQISDEDLMRSYSETLGR